MSAPRRWGRRAALALAGSGLTAAGLGGALPGGALGAEAPTGSTGTTETPSPPVTTTSPQAPSPAPSQGGGETPESSTTTSTTPAASAPATTPAPSSTSTTPSAPAEPSAAAPSAAPTVVVQRKQQVTPGRRSGASVTNAGSGGEGSGGSGAGGSKPTGEAGQKGGPSAVPPGTPNGVAPAPLAAGGEAGAQALLFASSAVSAQALDFYRIPLFLLPIYQAAAYQYDVPWQILAAINEVETNYGTDLSVSTAGAVGWMQFMPATWLQYGVDATSSSYADPYNPVDAIFAAARYLHAAGASQNLHAAILAYNHSQEYVESVLLRARLIASYPRSVIGTLTGLVDGRPPTPGARVGAVGSLATGGLGAALPGGSAGSAPGGVGTAPAGASGASPGAGGSSSATAGAVPLSVAPTPADAAANATTGSAASGSAAHGAAGSVAAGSAAHATAGGAGGSATAGGKPTAGSAGAHPGLTPPPPPQVAARRAEAAANAPAKPSQLVELLGAPGAPVMAVENGRIVHRGHSHALGRYLVLRDIYGDIFTYAGLGSIAPRYRPSAPAPARITRPAVASPGSADPAPRLPATAGHQPPVTLKVSSHAARTLAPVSAPVESEGETAPPGMGRVRLFAHPGNPIARTAAARAARSAGVGNGNWLALRTGSIVSEGTVLGHLNTPVGASAGKLRFAVRPGGDNGTIDPRPLLANWKQLGTALHPRGSRGANPLLGATAGEALLMSKGELQRAVLADAAIQFDACGRRDVAAGDLDRRVLAVLEFLSRSGLQPTVGGLVCPRGASTASLPGAASGGGPVAARTAARVDHTAVDISAVNGVAIAGHQGRGTIADVVIRTLLTLRGRFAPQRIVSLMKYPEAPTTQALPSGWDYIHIDFPPPRSAPAHAAAANATAAAPLAVTGDLSEAQWSQLIERIAGLPKPKVAAAPSKAAISDPQAAPTNRELGSHG